MVAYCYLQVLLYSGSVGRVVLSNAKNLLVNWHLFRNSCGQKKKKKKSGFYSVGAKRVCVCGSGTWQFLNFSYNPLPCISKKVRVSKRYRKVIDCRCMCAHFQRMLWQKIDIECVNSYSCWVRIFRRIGCFMNLDGELRIKCVWVSLNSQFWKLPI